MCRRLGTGHSYTGKIGSGQFKVFCTCYKGNIKATKFGEKSIFSIEQISKLNFPELTQDLKYHQEMFVELNCNTSKGLAYLNRRTCVCK